MNFMSLKTRENVLFLFNLYLGLKDSAFTAAEKDAKFSRGLRPGSMVFSEHMNDWRYLSVRDLEQNEFFSQK